MAKTTVTLDETNFQKEVLEAEKPVLVDFWAEWCMPCKMMEPVLEEMAGELHEKLIVAKLNTESPQRGAIANLFQVRSIPNMKLFYKGKIVNEFIGFRPANVFRQELEAALLDLD